MTVAANLLENTWFRFAPLHRACLVAVAVPLYWMHWSRSLVCCCVFFTNETILLKLTTVELSVPSCHMYCSVDVQVAPLQYFVSDDVLEHVLMEFKVDHHSFAVYLVWRWINVMIINPVADCFLLYSRCLKFFFFVFQSCCSFQCFMAVLMHRNNENSMKRYFSVFLLSHILYFPKHCFNSLTDIKSLK